jgi:predicted GTPase
MNDIAIRRSLDQITSEENMKVLRKIADELIYNWGKGSILGVNEWETAKNAITREERKKALELFLEQLEVLVSNA